MHDIPELDRAGLRKFGLTTGAIIAVLFGLLIPWLIGFRFPLWPWLVVAVLGVWALLAPATLNPVYRGWMRFGLVIGAVMNRLLLGIMFFLIFSPIGVLMRLFGRDTMTRKFDARRASYRMPSRQPSAKNMERPF